MWYRRINSTTKSLKRLKELEKGKVSSHLMKSSYVQACVNLAKNVGEMRTETELLPQCWEQVSHFISLIGV